MHTHQPPSFGATSPDAARRLAGIFPEPTEVARRRRRRRIRVGAASASVLALLGVGFVAVEGSGSETVRLRTATVSTHDVDAVLTGVATIQAVSQASVAFTSAGTVREVSVAVGDRVVVGQQLAALDTEALEQALHEAQSVFAQAELSLANALDGTSSTSGSTTAGSTTAGSSTTRSTTAATTATASTTASDATSAGTTAGTTAAGATDRTAAQQAVLDAQRAVDAALTASDAALDGTAAVCDTGATDAAGSAETSTTTTSVVEPSTTGSDATSACRTALTAVRDAQRTTAEAQQTLAAAATRLDDLLTAAASTTTTATSTPTTAATTPTATATAPSGATGSTDSVSSEELIALQKAVDASGLNVLVAAQAVQRADIVAPLAGTVVAVGIAAGDTVTAASATQAVTIVSDGGMEVTTTVDVARVADVEVGQRAAVTVDGEDAELDGEVVAVAATPDSGSTSYRLTVAITDGSALSEELPNGATGTVSIVTDAVTSALAVPTSAVTATTDGYSVQLVDGTDVTTTAVEVGVAGDRWTEITSGVSEGQRVVLADLEEALPGSATATESDSGSGTTGQNGFPGGGGQFPTGGFPSGGFPGGGPPS